jgi:hypothetical protein
VISSAPDGESRSGVTQRLPRITLRVDELEGFRAAVIACSREDEHDLCERLLGQLASLEAQTFGADPDTELTFAPPSGGLRLAQRALEHLRAQPLRRRFRRDSAPRPRSLLRRSA